VHLFHVLLICYPAIRLLSRKCAIKLSVSVHGVLRSGSAEKLCYYRLIAEKIMILAIKVNSDDHDIIACCTQFNTGREARQNVTPVYHASFIYVGVVN